MSRRNPRTPSSPYPTFPQDHQEAHLNMYPYDDQDSYDSESDSELSEPEIEYKRRPSHFDLPPAPEGVYSYNPRSPLPARTPNTQAQTESPIPQPLRYILAAIGVLMLVLSLCSTPELTALNDTVACRIPGFRTWLDCPIPDPSVHDSSLLEIYEQYKSRKQELVEKAAAKARRGKEGKKLVFGVERNLDVKVREWKAETRFGGGEDGVESFGGRLGWMGLLVGEGEGLKKRLSHGRIEFLGNMIQLGVLDGDLQKKLLPLRTQLKYAIGNATRAVDDQKSVVGRLVDTSLLLNNNTVTKLGALQNKAKNSDSTLKSLYELFLSDAGKLAVQKRKTRAVMNTFTQYLTDQVEKATVSAQADLQVFKDAERVVGDIVWHMYGEGENLNESKLVNVEYWKKVLENYEPRVKDLARMVDKNTEFWKAVQDGLSMGTHHLSGLEGMRGDMAEWKQRLLEDEANVGKDHDNEETVIASYLVDLETMGEKLRRAKWILDE